MKKKRGQITKYFLKEVCLGAKMHNKAASTTMDTLKEILNDISTSCKDMSVGQTIM